MPADHPLAGRRKRRRSIELHDLVEVPFASFPPESWTRRKIDAAAAEVGKTAANIVPHRIVEAFAQMYFDGRKPAIVSGDQCWQDCIGKREHTRHHDLSSGRFRYFAGVLGANFQVFEQSLRVTRESLAGFGEADVSGAAGEQRNP